jgi:hypothetical protein
VNDSELASRIFTCASLVGAAMCLACRLFPGFEVSGFPGAPGNSAKPTKFDLVINLKTAKADAASKPSACKKGQNRLRRHSPAGQFVRFPFGA